MIKPETLSTLLIIGIFLVVGYLIVRFFRKYIHIIPLEKTAVIERRGRYKRTSTAKICILIPFVERLKSIPVGNVAELLDDRRFEDKKASDTPVEENKKKHKTRKKKIRRADELMDISYHTENCHFRWMTSSDGTDMDIDLLMSWHINDASKIVYSGSSVAEIINGLVRGTISEMISQHTTEELTTNIKSYLQSAMVDLIKASKQIGLSISKLDLVRFNLPEDMIAVLAERKKTAIICDMRIHEAEAYKQAMILKAEGRVEAMKLESEAEDLLHEKRLKRENSKIKVIKNAFKGHPEEYMKYLLSMQYLDTLHSISMEGGKLDVSLDDDINKLLVIPGRDESKTKKETAEEENKENNEGKRIDTGFTPGLRLIPEK